MTTRACPVHKDLDPVPDLSPLAGSEERIEIALGAGGQRQASIAQPSDEDDRGLPLAGGRPPAGVGRALLRLGAAELA